MAEEISARSLKSAPRSATLGGVGGGTGLVALSQAIGPTTTAGKILVYVAPAFSYGVGVLLAYINAEASRYFSNRVINSARKTLVDQLDNPRTSEEHKRKIQEQLERLEESVAAAELERVRILQVTPERR